MRLNIVIVKNRAMGDAIIGLGAVQYMRQLFPSAHISYMVPAWVRPIFSHVQTAAHQVIPVNLSSLDGFFETWNSLLQCRPDAVHELFQSGRTSKFLKLFSSLRPIHNTFHNHHHKGPGIVIDQGVIAPIIQRDLDGIYSHYGKDQLGPRPHFLNYIPVMKSLSPLTPHRRIILGAVATRQTKMWPLHSLVEFGQLALQQNLANEVVVPLSASLADQKIAEQIKLLDKKSMLKIIILPLEQLPNYFASSMLYVGNDTGLKHLAVACGIKTITLFGPEPPLEWHPYRNDRHPYFYKEPLECRTRTAHYCGLSQCDSMICLNEFTPLQVLKKSQILLES
jgi:heptosyltransferase-2